MCILYFFKDVAYMATVIQRVTVIAMKVSGTTITYLVNYVVPFANSKFNIFKLLAIIIFYFLFKQIGIVVGEDIVFCQICVLAVRNIIITNRMDDVTRKTIIYFNLKLS